MYRSTPGGQWRTGRNIANSEVHDLDPEIRHGDMEGVSLRLWTGGDV